MDNAIWIYKAIYDFHSNVPGELPLRIGDVLKLERVVDQQWWYGSKISHQQRPCGTFPASFVSKVNFPSSANVGQKFYVAVEDFIARRSGELNLLKGDLIIEVREIDAEWLEGTSGVCLQNRGIFPASFARQMQIFEKSDEALAKNAPQATIFSSSPENKPAGVRAKVTKKLDAKLPEEISLNVGEFLFIDKFFDKIWCEGRTADGEKCGIFPVGFVEILSADSGDICEPKNFHAKHATNFHCESSHGSTASSLPPFGSQIVTNSMASIKKENPSVFTQKALNFSTQNSSEPHGRTLYDFSAEYSEELSFPANKIVRIIKHVDEEWTLGEYNGRKGIFPSSYIEVLVDCTAIVTKIKCEKVLEEKFEKCDDQPTNFLRGNRNANFRSKTRKVAYDFNATVEGDLDAKIGDCLEILQEIDENWTKARNVRTSRVGMIPISFLSEDEAHFNDEEFNNLAFLAQNDDKMHKTASSAELRAALNDPSPSKCIKDRRNSERQCQTLPKKLMSRPTSQQFESSDHDFQLLDQKHAFLKMEEKRAENRVQRMRIFNEILQSERDYVKHLAIFQLEFKKFFQSIDVDGLLKGFDRIQLVAEKLVQFLEVEMEKDFVYQEIGSAFLALENEFKKVYGSFCQSYEVAQILLNQYEADESKQKILKDILHNVNREIICLDVNSILSRPVQRVLKYPLFISELLKCTDDSTSDKVKLIMALKVMNEVSHCINESKRRKELVQKYKKEDTANLTTKLSKINLHTFRKKSNRLSMRFSTSIGWSHSLKDEGFEAVEKQFKSVEKASRSFLRDLQCYCENLLAFNNKGLSVAENFDIFLAANLPKNRANCQFWTDVISQDLQRLFDNVSTKVREPINAVHLSCKGPEKLIAKRHDKFLDFESASARLCKERAKNEASDGCRLRALEEESKKCKAEFQALDLQLKTELPQFNQISCDILSMAFKALASHQRSFLYEIGKRYTNVNFSQSKCDAAAILENFRRDTGSISAILSQITFQSSDKKPKLARKMSLARKSSSSTNGSAEEWKNEKEIVYADIVSQENFQREVDRKNVMAKYPAGKIYKASTKYSAVHQMDLGLQVGDLVGAIVAKDPTGDDQRWFVDNGASKGFVPKSHLTKLSNFIDQTEPSSRDVRKNVKESVDYAEISRLKTKLAQQKKQLLERPRNERDKTSQNSSEFKHEKAVGGASLHYNVDANESTNRMSVKSSLTNHERFQSSDGQSGDGTVLYSTNHTESKTVLEPEAPCLKSTRSAPPPPPPNEASGEFSSTSTPPPLEIYVALYDHEASCDSELSLRLDELLCVHAKNDLQSNDEWWLVENEAGDVGYVPANYLSPAS